jgi:hypothetical protein
VSPRCRCGFDCDAAIGDAAAVAASWIDPSWLQLMLLSLMYYQRHWIVCWMNDVKNNHGDRPSSCHCWDLNSEQFDLSFHAMNELTSQMELRCNCTLASLPGLSRVSWCWLLMIVACGFLSRMISWVFMLYSFISIFKISKF